MGATITDSMSRIGVHPWNHDTMTPSLKQNSVAMSH